MGMPLQNVRSVLAAGIAIVLSASCQSEPQNAVPDSPPAPPAQITLPRAADPPAQPSPPPAQPPPPETEALPPPPPLPPPEPEPEEQNLPQKPNVTVDPSLWSSAQIDSTIITEGYKTFLNRLNKTNLSSFTHAMDGLMRHFSDASPEDAEAAFRAFQAFYKAYIRGKGGEYGIYDPTYSLFSKEDIRTYGAHGIIVYAVEGDAWMLREDPDVMERAASILSGPFKEYMTLYNEELIEPIVGDASLGLSWEELRHRIIRFERFVKKYPDRPEWTGRLRSELPRMMQFYLLGLDNTPAYNFWRTGKLEPELEESYLNFIIENHDSDYHQLISDLYLLLKKDDFEVSRDLIRFLSENGYKDVALEGAIIRYLDEGPRIK